jgi:hypothetical protein
LKTHGIRLKTRDRSKRQRQGSLSKRAQATSEEDDEDEGSDPEDATEERPFHEQTQLTASGGVAIQQYVPSATGASSSTYLGATSARTFAAPQDRGLGPALHRGHGTDPTSEPLGFNAALAMLEFNQPHNQLIHASSSEASRAKGKGKATPSAPHLAGHDDLAAVGVEISTIKKGNSTAKRRWQVETSGGVRLRKSREAARESRRQRGSGQFDINDSGLVTANESETLEGDDSDGNPENGNLSEGQDPSNTTTQVAELEESALRMLCPEPKRPSTPRIPQLDRAALDKLIAPPLAWQEYQNRLKQQEETGAILGLDEKIALAHRQVGSASDSALADAVPSLDSALPSHTDSTLPLSNIFGGNQIADIAPTTSTFHTSSMRTSVSGLALSIQGREPSNEEGMAIHGGGIGVPPSLAPVGSKSRPNSFSSTSSIGISGGVDANFSTIAPAASSNVTQPAGLLTESSGYWRADGQWVPKSMTSFRNVEQLRGAPPFTLQGLEDVNLNVPFHRE